MVGAKERTRMPPMTCNSFTHIFRKYGVMSRFWAANESSSEGEKDSDSDSYDGEPQTQRQAGGKFGATFQESDSGKCVVL